VAVTIDWPTQIFSIPQADLLLITGTLYEADTEVDIRQAINVIMASEEGIVFETPITHNTEVTVAGTTFARFIEMINGYSIIYTPDTQWSVRYVGSNNNLFDIENGILNQNQVQVIPGNSAGLVVISTGSGLSAAQDAKITAIFSELDSIEGGFGHAELMRGIFASIGGLLSGAPTGPIIIKGINGTKTRFDVTVDVNGNRTIINTRDLTP